VVHIIRSTELPNQIKDQIRSNLELNYDKQKLNKTLFAVRSSALGEDSDEMSAAGQMTTYLGVKGLDAIYDAVMKCWSSQFEFVAVEYKRGYGQDINSLMAVVIQEMINCDSAGVLFTCDPLTGDEREIIITANYGIGESVVSAMAEPDTIRVSVNIKDNSYDSRSVKEIKSIEIGSKAKIIKINDSEDGTIEMDNQNQNQCCISEKNAKQLANIGLKVWLAQNIFDRKLG
jgi:pyruvate,water dikinase